MMAMADNRDFIILSTIFMTAMIFGLLAVALYYNANPEPVLPPLTGDVVVQTTQDFNISFNLYEGFKLQTITPDIIVNFNITTGNLTGVGNIYATTMGGTMTITPTSDGTITITANDTNFALYLNNNPHQPAIAFSSGVSFTLFWLY